MLLCGVVKGKLAKIPMGTMAKADAIVLKFCPFFCWGLSNWSCHSCRAPSLWSVFSVALGLTFNFAATGNRRGGDANMTRYQLARAAATEELTTLANLIDAARKQRDVGSAS
jgi:hypothetical protein